MRKILFAAITATLVSAGHAQTPAQPATAQAAPGQVNSTLGGTAVAGVCLLSQQEVFRSSKAGKAAIERLRFLTEQAKAEIETDRAPLNTDIEKFNSEQAKLSEAQRGERRKALADRLKPIEEKAALRQRELEATQIKVTGRLAGEFEALVAQAYKQRNCGLLVDRNSILGGNLTNDLTPAVIQALDAKLTTITFDRENLAAAPAGTRTAGSN